MTYFEPTTQLPSATQYTNRDGLTRDFNGFEVTFSKRMANRWSMNASYAFNDAAETYEASALEDPTCVQNVCPGTNEYAPESAGSGIGNVFQNAKWLVKLNGRVQLPYDFNFAANMLGRQGFPFPQSILTPNRANGGGQGQVMLDPMGTNRYDNMFTVDLRFVGGAEERPVGEEGLDAALVRKKRCRPAQERKLDGQAEARLITQERARLSFCRVQS